MKRSLVQRAGICAALLTTLVTPSLIASPAGEPATPQVAANVEAPPQAPFPIDDTNPTSSLPSASERTSRPLEYGYLLLELTGRAEEALEAKDFSRAARYFEALTTAVPEAAIGHRKLCQARSGARDVEGAISACRQATASEGALSGDLSRLLTALLARDGAPSPADIDEFDRVARHAEEQHVDPLDVLPQQCSLAVRVRDEARLAACVARLQERAPASTDPRTASFAWVLAMWKSDQHAARGAYAAAEAAGHDAEKLAEMKRTMDQAFRSNTPWIWLGLSVAAVAGLGALVLLRRDPGTRSATTSAPARS